MRETFGGVMAQTLAGKIEQMLSQRQNHCREVTTEELAHGLSRVIWLFHDELYLKLPGAGFIRRLAQWDDSDPAVATVIQAWSYGVRLRLMTHRQLLPSLPLQALASMPLTLEDHRGIIVQMMTHDCVTWRDLTACHDCWLLVSKKTLLTALAQELCKKNNITLIRQESLCIWQK